MITGAATEVPRDSGHPPAIVILNGGQQAPVRSNPFDSLT